MKKKSLTFNEALWAYAKNTDGKPLSDSAVNGIFAVRYKVQRTTIQNWRLGKTAPPELIRDMIAKDLGIPVNELFPNT